MIKKLLKLYSNQNLDLQIEKVKNGNVDNKIEFNRDEENRKVIKRVYV